MRCDRRYSTPLRLLPRYARSLAILLAVRLVYRVSGIALNGLATGAMRLAENYVLLDDGGRHLAVIAAAAASFAASAAAASTAAAAFTITLPLHRHPSPLTAHRSPLTTHLSPFTLTRHAAAHGCRLRPASGSGCPARPALQGLAQPTAQWRHDTTLPRRPGAWVSGLGFTLPRRPGARVCLVRPSTQYTQ